MKKTFIYDITCLIAQQVYETPSGTVRVDLRYTQYFLSNHPGQTLFIKQQGNRLIVIGTDEVRELITHLGKKWSVQGETDDSVDMIGFSNLEFRIAHRGLWDPDFDTFFSMPFMDRFNYLLNQELTEIFGMEFRWVNRLPNIIKIWYSLVAGLSRYPALLLLRTGQFIGVFLYTKSLRTAFKFITMKRKRYVLLNDAITETGGNQYYYIYTAYNRGFPFQPLKQISDRARLEYIVFIHDLIIIYYPEYFLPVNHQEQATWLKGLLTLKPRLIANSNTTREYIERFAREHRRKLHPVTTAHIGVEPQFLNSRHGMENSEGKIYFIVISTIEPRKNHLLLLNIWREMALKNLLQPVPELYLVGKRGWENENIIDMVERCEPLNGVVHELVDLNDAELISLLRGSRALLYPSFCEGWGMPIVEALTLGVPVICSDIPELRESGQDIPDYISPIDGSNWMQTIIDYSGDNSAMHDAQLQRIAGFQPPTWDQHFKDTMGQLLAGPED